jgi:signal transduction histidine kinase
MASPFGGYTYFIGCLVSNKTAFEDDANACATPASRRTPSPPRSRASSAALRLELAREEERASSRASRRVGQVLTSLARVREAVDQFVIPAEAGIQLVNKLQSLIGLIEVSIQSVRQISSELRPAVLDHLGLREAIQWEATKFEARTGIRCRVSWELKSEPPDRTRQLAMFRILQEALTNVARHAHAGAVRIMVRDRGRMLTLTIRDNGRGITKAELASVESIGLLGMTERARLLGGRVTIAGSPGRGTAVTVTVPSSTRRH